MTATSLRWTIADVWTLTLRALQFWRREPTQIIAGLGFSIMLVVLFAFLFGGAMTVPGGGPYIEFLMPGMFVMTMAFGTAETMIAVTQDADKGVTDRFRSMPMSSAAVLLGRGVSDMLYASLGLAVMIGCGLVLGWRWHTGPAEVAAAIGLLLFLRFALVWAGMWMGLVFSGAAALAIVQTVMFPVTMVTNTFAPTETMPPWLGTLAEWNPLSATVTATRELFGNPGVGGDSFVAQHALPLAFLWPVVIIAAFLPLAVRRYRRLDR
jgi:ABC-2 type transport system permease protein